MHYEWLQQRFKEVASYHRDATLEEGLQYAIACLYRDLEPGLADGEFNVFEALTAIDQKALAQELGVDRSTIWRRIKDYRN